MEGVVAIPYPLILLQYIPKESEMVRTIPLTSKTNPTQKIIRPTMFLLDVSFFSTSTLSFMPHVIPHELG